MEVLAVGIITYFLLDNNNQMGGNRCKDCKCVPNDVQTVDELLTEADEIIDRPLTPPSVAHSNATATTGLLRSYSDDVFEHTTRTLNEARENIESPDAISEAQKAASAAKEAALLAILIEAKRNKLYGMPIVRSLHNAITKYGFTGSLRDHQGKKWKSLGYIKSGLKIALRKASRHSKKVASIVNSDTAVQAANATAVAAEAVADILDGDNDIFNEEVNPQDIYNMFEAGKDEASL